MPSLADLSVASSAAALTNALTIHAEDTWGNVYSAPLGHDLGDSSTYTEEKAGVAMATLFRHVRLAPTTVADPNKVLNSFFSVHIWTTFTANSEVIELDLNLHNSYCDPDGAFVSAVSGKVVNSSTLSQLFFRRVWVDVPAGTVVASSWPEPLQPGVVGTVWTLFDVEPGGPLPPKLGTGNYSAGVAHTLPVFGERQVRVALGPSTVSQEVQDKADKKGWAQAQDGVNATGDRVWSWQNPACAGYDVQRFIAPVAADTAPLTSAWEDVIYPEVMGALSAGTAITTMGAIATLVDTNSIRTGIQHPTGNTNAGATGGAGIYHTSGAELIAAPSEKSLLAVMAIDRCYNDRHPSGIYAPSGAPLYVEDLETATGLKWGTDYGNEFKADRLNRYELVNHQGYTASKPSDLDIALGFTYAMAGPAGQYHSVPAAEVPEYLPMFRTDLAEPATTTGNTNDLENQRIGGEPPYSVGNATGNSKYAQLDWAHIVRRTQFRRPLLYLYNDPMAKLKARAEAAHTRLAWADRLTPGHTDQSSLKVLEDAYEAFPASHNQGADVGRADGWAANTVGTALYITPPGAERGYLQGWADRFASLFGTIQMPNGVWQRQWSSKVGNWTITNYGVYAAQAIEHGIIMNGLHSIGRAGANTQSQLKLAVKMVWEYLWLFHDSSGNLIPNIGVEDLNHIAGGATGSDFPVMPLQPVGYGVPVAKAAFTTQTEAPPAVSEVGIWGFGYPPTAGSPGLATEFDLPHDIYSVNVFDDAGLAKGIELVFYVDTPNASEPTFFSQPNFKRYLRINYPAIPLPWLQPAIGRSLQFVSLTSEAGTNPETSVAGTKFTLRLRDAFFGGMAPYTVETGWTAGDTVERYTLGYAPLALYHGFTANTGAGADLNQWPWPPSNWVDPYPDKDKPLPINLGTPKVYSPPALQVNIGAGYKATVKFGKNIYGYGSVETGEAPFVSDNFQYMLVCAEVARLFQTGTEYQGTLRMLRALVRNDGMDFSSSFPTVLQNLAASGSYAAQKNAMALLGWVREEPQAFVGL